MTGKKTGRLPNPDKEPRYFEPYHIDSMISAIGTAVKSKDTERDKLLIKVLWYTGGRVSEVLGILVSDILFTRSAIRLKNLKQGWWTSSIEDGEIKRTYHKKDAEKNITVLPEFLEEVKLYIENRKLGMKDLLFARGDGRPIVRQRVYELVCRLAAQAGAYGYDNISQAEHTSGIKKGDPIPFSTHKLRHGIAVELLNREVPLDIISEHLGHQRVETTKIYTKIVNPQKQKKLFNAMRGKSANDNSEEVDVP